MDEHSQRTAVYRIGNLDKYYKEYDADYNLARDGHFITVVVEVEDSSIVEVEKKTLLAASVPCVIRPLRVGKTRVTFYLYEMLGARYPDASSTERKNAAPGRLFDTLTLTVTVEALDLGNNVSTYDPAADGFPYELGSYRVGENVILTLYGDTEKRGLEQRVVMVFTGTGRMWTMFEFPDGLSKSSWAVGENACVSGEICAVKAVFNEGITEINRFNFEYTSISEVILPSTLKVIGAWAFCSNDYLKKIVLPEGLERIEESAFHEVSVMEAPVLPSTLTYIGDYAFVGGIGNMFTLGRYNWKDPWTELEIPKSVTYIGWGAFINRANTVLVFEEGVDISGYHREWRLVKTGVNVKTIFK